MGRANGMVVRPGIYRVIPKVNLNTGVVDSVLSADEVTGNPATVWPTACGASPDAWHDPSYAYVFRVKPDCDDNSADDELQNPPPTCTTNCSLADMNGNGTVTVQDIFDFLPFTSQTISGLMSTERTQSRSKTSLISSRFTLHALPEGSVSLSAFSSRARCAPIGVGLGLRA